MTLTAVCAPSDVQSVVAAWAASNEANLPSGAPALGVAVVRTSAGAGKTDFLVQAVKLAHDWAGTQRRQRGTRIVLPSARPLIDGDHRAAALRRLVEEAAAWARFSAATIETLVTSASAVVVALVAFVGRRLPLLPEGRPTTPGPAQLRIAPLTSAPCAPPAWISLHPSEGLLAS